MVTRDLFKKLQRDQEIDDETKILIVAAHPDDEIIGAGSILGMLKNVSFLHTTDGSPGNEIIKTEAGLITSTHYSQQRFNEFYEALKIAECKPKYHVKFGLKDQQTSYQLTLLTIRMLETIRNINPEFIFVHPFEGGHPDHDAASFAVHNCASILKTEGCDIKIIEYTSYFNNNGLMQTGEFLTAAAPVVKIELTDEQKKRKMQMYDCFISQQNVIKYFNVTWEKYREAPDYNFTRPPSEEKLYYDLFNWGIDSHAWYRNAKIALNEISLLKKYIHDNP